MISYDFFVQKVRVFKTNRFYLLSWQSVIYEHSLTLLLYCPSLCFHSFLRVAVNKCRFCIVCLYLYCCWRSNYLRREGFGFHINKFNPPTFLCLSQATDLDFQHYICIQQIEGRCGCSFCLTFGRIVHHRCFNFLFII